MTERLIPGVGFVEESVAGQKLVPGLGFIDETAFGVTVSCTVGNAVSAGSTSNIYQGNTITATVGNAVADGSTASTGGNVSINCSVGDAVAAGATATIETTVSISCTVGNAASAGATASILQQIMTEPLINNTGTILSSQAVSWSWIPAGRIGTITGITVTDGTGTTDANGRLVPGISVATGILLTSVQVTDATDDAVYYQAF